MTSVHQPTERDITTEIPTVTKQQSWEGGRGSEIGERHSQCPRGMERTVTEPPPTTHQPTEVQSAVVQPTEITSQREEVEGGTRVVEEECGAVGKETHGEGHVANLLGDQGEESEQCTPTQVEEIVESRREEVRSEKVKRNSRGGRRL